MQTKKMFLLLTLICSCATAAIASEAPTAASKGFNNHTSAISGHILGSVASFDNMSGAKSHSAYEPRGYDGHIAGSLYTLLERSSWKERAAGIDLLTEQQKSIGIGGELKVELTKDVPLYLRGEFGLGRADYNGSTFGGDVSYPITTNVFYQKLQFQAEVGRDFHARKLTVEPFAGVGYKYWSREIDDTVAVINGQGELVHGYTENWNEVDLRTGVNLEYRAGRHTSLYGRTAVKIPVYTSNEADIIGIGNSKVYPKGQVAPYVEAGIRAGRTLLGVFFETDHFEASTPSDKGTYQPDSKNWLFGVKLGASWGY